MPRRQPVASELPQSVESFRFEVREAEPLRIVEPDGTLRPGMKPSLSDDDALFALRWMVFSRGLDTWGTRLQRMGRIGLYTPVNGQEATVVGAAMALDPKIDRPRGSCTASHSRAF
jgi:pyruvate dehydrogenase E1 component alpha subunit